jgi:hypothetical protein
MYILAKDYGYEDFDADGVGDIWRTGTDYLEMDSKEKILSYLMRNIYEEDGKTKPGFTTIKEYCDAYGFRFYERTTP